MMNGTESLMQMWGLARVGAAAIRTNAMIDAGALTAITPDHRADLASAAALVRVTAEHTERFDKLAKQVRTESEKLLKRLRDPP